jgi:molecular chaperone GrpE
MNENEIFEKSPEEIIENMMNGSEGEEVNGEVENPIEEVEVISPEVLLQKQVDEWKEKHLRLFAEFDNYKKRMAKEKMELFATAGKDIIKDILPIMDDMERAILASSTSTDIEAVKEGLNLIADKLTKTLEKKGVKPIISKGEVFDTELHEAITEIPAPTEEMKGKIIDEVEKGYTLNDKIIRYSKVVVGK